jgi:hypothetical protein
MEQTPLSCKVYSSIAKLPIYKHFWLKKLAAMSTAVDASVAVTEQEVIFYIRLRTCSSYQIIHEKIFICVPHCFVILNWTWHLSYTCSLIC